MLSAKERLSILLAKGYFPKELPPTFVTRDFGRHADAIMADWEAAELFKRTPPGKVPNAQGKKRASFGYKLKTADAEIVSVPKRGYERRNLQVTHPLPQALLAKEIADHWVVIQKWLARGRYTIDRCEIGVGHPRAIKAVNFDAHQAKKSFIEASADWIIRTDITRFYPSIYTHSIPWAAYGKENVKSNLKLYEGSLADRLDTLARACNRNQTVGIPIGPETSRILAEVISSRIDTDFNDAGALADERRIDRLQDDWFIGTNSLAEAERALSGIALAYRSYGLDINGSKTAVERTISPLSETWTAEIGAFLSHRPGAIQGTRLKELLDLTMRLQLDNRKEPVVGYVLSILESHPVPAREAEKVESFLIRAATVAPSALDRICQALINLYFNTKRVALERVRSRFTELAERAILNGETYEAMWLVYTLRGLKQPLRSKAFTDQMVGVRSSVLSLILLDMKNRGLCATALPVNHWLSRIDEDSILVEGEWLLAYEGIRHGWLPDPRGLMATPLLSAMHARNVQFYDERRNVTRSEIVVKRRRAARRRRQRDVAAILNDLRGFSFGDYQ